MWHLWTLTYNCCRSWPTHVSSAALRGFPDPLPRFWLQQTLRSTRIFGFPTAQRFCGRGFVGRARDSPELLTPTLCMSWTTVKRGCLVTRTCTPMCGQRHAARKAQDSYGGLPSHAVHQGHLELLDSDGQPATWETSWTRTSKHFRPQPRCLRRGLHLQSGDLSDRGNCFSSRVQKRALNELPLETSRWTCAIEP